MNNVEKKIDEALHAALSALPSLPFMRLVRQDRGDTLAHAREALAGGNIPTFSYAKAQALELAPLHDALADFGSRIDSLAPNAEIAAFYHAKTEELALRARLVGCMQSGDDLGASTLARTLYGEPTVSLAELEQHLAEMISLAGPKKTKVKYWVDADMFAEMTRRMFAHYGMDNARVRVAQRRSIKIGHHRITHALRLVVPATLHITRRRAQQLLAHEIEAHALRHLNGVQGPLHILARGMRGYLATDEGLAMTLQEEYAQGNHWPGFWESYAVALALVHEGTVVFARLREARTALAVAMSDPHAAAIGEDAAWRLCLRVYRGIARPDRPGLVFPRDHVYLSGYRTISALADINPLYVGHASLADLPVLTALGIAPHRTPDHVSKQIVSDVVRAMGTRENV